MSSIAIFADNRHFSLFRKLLHGTIIAAKIGQAIANMKLWLSKNSTSHRQLLAGRCLNGQHLAFKLLILPLGYHASSSTSGTIPTMSLHLSKPSIFFVTLFSLVIVP